MSRPFLVVAPCEEKVPSQNHALHLCLNPPFNPLSKFICA